MNIKQTFFLITSYITCTILMYCFLMSKNNEELYQSYIKTTSNRLDEILAKIEENKNITIYINNTIKSKEPKEQSVKSINHFICNYHPPFSSRNLIEKRTILESTKHHRDSLRKLMAFVSTAK